MHWNCVTWIIWIYSSTCQGFMFPGNSAYGIFAAVAVPLNLPHRNVFVSYNFEANYNLPGQASDIIPGPYQRFTPVDEMIVGPTDTDTGDDDATQDTEESGRKQANTNDVTPKSKQANKIKSKKTKKKKTKKKSKALITRRAIYRIFRDKLEISGFDGVPCLLKLICEANASLVGAHNGVLGSILHILLTPSTSSYERIPKKYYEAEEKGVQGDCYHYEEICPNNMLDIISAPIEEFILNKL